MKQLDLAGLCVGNDQPLTIIAGPCQLQSADHAQMIAGRMAEICKASGAQFIFKASFDKANRTSAHSPRGPGMEDGLKMLQSVRDALSIPILTDVHTPDQCAPVVEVCDVLQIPAFLCRQTDLIVAAANTGAAVNIKKGQFMAPWDIPHVVTKIETTGNTQILLTERGSSFGYNTLVTDMRSLPHMATTGYPVVMDATHSVQQPGGNGDKSGGQRQFAPAIARAAVSLGIAAVFIETHDSPDNAPSDGLNMIPLDEMPSLIQSLMQFDQLAKTNPIRI